MPITDDEKVKKMFAIRKEECPELADAAKRIEEYYLCPSFIHYWSLLKMYNERFPDDK